MPLHTVVLDPGHGGRDAGVRGPTGLLEKAVTFAVARKLSLLLQEQLGVRVILTRMGDYDLPLLERTAIANHGKGQLFISLHAEGDLRPQAEGYRVFVLNRAPPAPGGPSTPEDSRLRAILWDLAQTSYLNESARLARLIADGLTQKTGLRGESVREAQLLVLRGAQMPAVLVSVAHLTNPHEENQLRRDEFLDRVAQGLYKAIRAFISGADLVN